MNKFLAKEGEHAIICIAAGNEADKAVALKKNFEHANEMVKTFITQWFLIR